MIIKFIDAFDRSFAQLERNIQKEVRETLKFFRENPMHPSLRNHELTGSMTGKRSISVNNDIRIIFIEKGGYIEVLMLDVGGHDEVYFD